MAESYSEQTGGHDDGEGGSVFDAVEAMGVQVLGIRPLPVAAEEMAVGGEIWQVGDVADAGAEDRLPGNVREKLALMRGLGLSVDYLITGHYIGRSDNNADLYRAFEASYFAFKRARPMLNIGLTYGLGSAEYDAER